VIVSSPNAFFHQWARGTSVKEPAKAVEHVLVRGGVGVPM
jgi:hypothetical protein